MQTQHDHQKSYRSHYCYGNYTFNLRSKIETSQPRKQAKRIDPIPGFSAVIQTVPSISGCFVNGFRMVTQVHTAHSLKVFTSVFLG